MIQAILTHALAFLAGGLFTFHGMGFLIAVAEYVERHGGASDDK